MLSGRYRLTVHGAVHEIGPGDSYAIPASSEHSIEVVAAGAVVDVFSPPREDYR